MMEYRLNFFIGLFSFLFVQGAAIAFVSTVFQNISTLHGWNLYDILFIYAIACLGRFIHQTFFDQLWVLGLYYVRTGNFDRLLVRPLNPLFHLISDKALNQDGLGQLVTGIAALLYTIPHLTIEWGFLNIFLLIIMVLSSGMIFASLNLLFATLSFWMMDSLPIMGATFQLSDFAKYPITIYPKMVSVLITWLIPYAFTSFYPADYLLHHTGIGYLTPFIACLLIMISYGFWKYGLTKYNSTGS